MVKMLDIKSDFNSDLNSDNDFSHECPERALIAAIINQALKDANDKTGTRYGGSDPIGAIRFLLTKESDPYFELLDMDPQTSREMLIKQTAAYPHYATFRNNHRKWKIDSIYHSYNDYR